MKTTEKNIVDVFSFETLSENEMMEIRGGSRPKTRDKDIFDDDFEEGNQELIKTLSR